MGAAGRHGDRGGGGDAIRDALQRHAVLRSDLRRPKGGAARTRDKARAIDADRAGGFRRSARFVTCCNNPSISYVY